MCCRGGYRAATTSKMERFVIIVNGWKPLTIITKRSIMDVAAALDPPLCCDATENNVFWKYLKKTIFIQIDHSPVNPYPVSVLIPPLVFGVFRGY